MMRERHDYNREDGNSEMTGRGHSKSFFISLLLFIQQMTARSPGSLDNDTATNAEDHHQHPPTMMDDTASGPATRPPTTNTNTTTENQVTLRATWTTRTTAMQRGWQGDDNHHHTAPPTVAMSNCLQGGNREQWGGDSQPQG
jgi:hypothetical protein